MAKTKLKKFDCSISQVNYARVIVFAKDEEEAEEKAYRKWRKNWAHSRVERITEVTE